MSYGVPIITTRWRSLPELFPSGYAGLVDIRSPNQIAKAFTEMFNAEPALGLRQQFLKQFTMSTHLSALATALLSVEVSRPQLPNRK